MIPRLAGLLAVVVVVVACGAGAPPPRGSEPPASPPAGTGGRPLETTRWILPAGAVPGLPAGATVDAFFYAGRLSGRGPCNTYGASYTLDGARLRITELGSTKMSCGGPLDLAEQAYFAALAAMASHEISGDTLALRDAAGSRLIEFRAAGDGGHGNPATTLPGTAWRVTGYAGATGVATGVIPGTTISLEFGVTGSAGGVAGCNHYGGEFQADPDTGSLAFGPLAATEMACDPPPTMAQESAYLAALRRTAAYRIADGRLALLDEGGTVLAVAEPALPAS